MNRTIFVHLANGFEEIEAITPIDILRRAGFHVTTVSVSGSLSVEGAHGIILIADQLIEEADYSNVDMILLPGGMPGAKNLDECELLKTKIDLFAKENRYLAAICAAPMVFGHLGLLADKKATCYPGFESHLQGAILSEDPVVVSDKIITARGVGVAIDFSLKIIELLDDKISSEAISKQIVYSKFN